MLEKASLALEQRLGRYPSDEEMASELGVGLDEYHKLLDETKGISLLPENIHDVVCENRESAHLASESDDLFKHTYRQEIQLHLTEAIGGLSEKEQLVLSLYYFEELTMKEIGLTLGYTESRISQIHTKAMLKLRTRLSRKLGREDLPGCVETG
ncbi:MAG: sigma-70 family RNA polymerase sigma factor [Acidobacteriota bacterium]